MANVQSFCGKKSQRSCLITLMADMFDFVLESGVSNASITIKGPPEGGEDSENEDVNEDDLSSDRNYE